MALEKLTKLFGGLGAIIPETTWDKFANRLADPYEHLGKKFVADFERFSNDPRYQPQLANMAAHSENRRYVFAAISETGVVDVTMAVDGSPTEWQSKPDGSTYRGQGFRSSTTFGGNSKITPVVLACLDKLPKSSGHAEAVERAKDSFQKDMHLFEHDEGALNNLVYGKQ